jgi:excisionase family DNA binding protein
MCEGAALWSLEPLLNDGRPFTKPRGTLSVFDPLTKDGPTRPLLTMCDVAALALAEPLPNSGHLITKPARSDRIIIDPLISIVTPHSSSSCLANRLLFVRQSGTPRGANQSCGGMEDRMNEEPLSVERAARLMGASATFLYRIIAEKKLPTIAVGRYIRVTRAAVKEFQRTNPPPRPITKIVAPREQLSPRRGDTNGKPRPPTRTAA